MGTESNGSRIKLLDNLSDARKVMSEHIGQQAMLNAAQFNNVVEFQFKPTFIKVISGLWLLVAGRDSFMEVYSVHTLRRACVI